MKRWLYYPTPPVVGPPVVTYRVWYDATRITGLVNNDKVVQWDDLGVNGLHLATGIVARQPLYKTNVLNGLPGVYFDGVDDWLQHPAILYFPTGYQHTLFMVMANIPVGPVSPGWIFDTNNPSALSRRFGRQYNQAGINKMTFSRDVDVDSILPYSPGENILYALKTDGASSLFRLNRSGGRQNTFTCSTNTDGSLGPFTMGAQSGITAGFCEMTMCEFILYPSALSTPDFEDVEDYLATKWGI